MSPNEDLLHRALQAFNRGYAGAPGISRPRQVGKTAAGVQAVIDLLHTNASQPQGDVCSCPEHGTWLHADDIDRMVREIDVALHGDGAAARPKLCDIVVPVTRAMHDTRRWRYVRELAWFVDAAKRAYSVREPKGRYASWEAWPSVDWDEIERVIDQDMGMAAIGVSCSDTPTVEETMTALCLVGDTEHITDADVEDWTPQQRTDAFAWAMALHVRASDNDDVEVPPRPAFTMAGAEVPRG